MSGFARFRIKEVRISEVLLAVLQPDFMHIVCPAHSHTHSQSLSLALRNIFGRAEQLEVTSGTSFPLWGHNVQLQFTKPYYKNFDKKYANQSPCMHCIEL